MEPRDPALLREPFPSPPKSGAPSLPIPASLKDRKARASAKAHQADSAAGAGEGQDSGQPGLLPLLKSQAPWGGE